MIPKNLHHVWLGSEPPSELHFACRKSTVALHSEWSLFFWTEESVLEAEPLKSFQLHRLASALGSRYDLRADILRYAVLYLYGGVYLDMDIYCLRPLDALLNTVLLYGDHGTIQNEEPLPGQGRKSNAVLGCPPKSIVMRQILEYVSIRKAVGIHVFGEVLASMRDIPPPHPYQVFCPHYWTQSDKRYRVFPETKTIHCWKKLNYDIQILRSLANVGQHHH